MSAKILIIDDDEFTRKILSTILQRDTRITRFSPEILLASDGRAGVELFERERPTLVIVDLFMPKMDGFAVCKRLRELASDEDLAIAVTSGVYKDASISKQLEDECGARFFAKPYQLKSIAEFALQILSSRTSVAPPESEAAPGASSAKSGDLAVRNAAALFWDLLDEEATGRLLLRRNQVVRQIEFFVGHPVSVTTNVREETLGQFLVARRIIDVAILRKAIAVAASKKQRLGETLIEMGSLSPQQLIKQLTDQTRLKLVRALRWQKGSWSFRSASPRNRQGNALDIAEVIVSGLASTARVDPPSPEVQALRGQALILSERGQRMLNQLGLSISDAFAKHFRQGIRGDELVRQGVNLIELYTCLDVLHACDGLVPQVSAAIPHVASDQRSAPLSLRVLADSSDRQASRGDLHSALFDGNARAHPPGASGPLAGLETSGLWPAEGSAPLDLDAAPPVEPAPAEAKVSPPEASVSLEEESTVSVSFSAIPKKSHGPSAREDVIAEFLRIQEKSLYEILEVQSDSAADEIEASYRAHAAAFAKEKYQSAKLGRDYQKLDVVQAAYENAHRTLCDASERERYDASRARSAADIPDAPSLSAELEFREAEELLAARSFPEAIAKLESSVAMAPHEAAYRASLGWALFVEGGEDALAADRARPHLNAALALSPDSGLVHEYKGRVHAALGDDPDAAIMHLGRALDDDPRRGDALIALEKLHLGRGEARELEAVYRRIIFRLVDNHGGEEAVIWSRLGDLHAHYMQDDDSALVAYERALRLLPKNAALQAKCALRRSGGLAPFYTEADALVAAWQEKPGSPEALQTLFARAQAQAHHDSCFLTASALVAFGSAASDVDAVYQRYRPRFAIRAQQQLDGKRWEELLHPDDDPQVGKLYALLAPVIQLVAPAPGAAEELEKADRLGESAVPPDFLAVRNYVAHVLGLATPEVRSRSDYERNISVAAVDPPVLLAGYDILTCTSKLELCFRLGRAMTYLRPGRATAAGSPARALKSAMLACYALRAPHVEIPDLDGQVEAFKDALGECDSARRAQVEELVVQISRDHPTLNLSRWSRVLSRTADRAGLLLSGDIPLAKRIAGELGDPAAARALLAFAVSPGHLRLRQAMGLSVEV